MGHWNVFCAITHMSIGGGDRCVAVWASPREFQDQYSGLAPKSIFYRGTYDSYGRIEFDKDQKYRELITEDMMAAPSMFILESVYDELNNFAIGKYGDGSNTGSVYDNGNLNSYSLELIGFEKQKNESTDPRYKIIYKHSSEPDKEVWSDGQWIEIHNGSKIDRSIYGWDKFEKHFPNVDYSILHNNPSELLNLEKNYSQYKKDCEFWRELGKKMRPYQISTFCEHNFVSPEMIPYLEHEDFRREVAKLVRVYWFMYANNLKFGYRFHGGPQDGNLNATIKLHDMLGKAIAAELENRKEWEDEDED